MSPARRPRPRRTWPQRLIIGVNVLIVATALMSALVLAYAKETVSGIARVSFGATLDEAGQPTSTNDNGESVDGQDTSAAPLKPALNFLLVGVDSIANLPSDHILRQTRSGTKLTDTLIVLRVDPNTGVASAMSIPRDLWVSIDGGPESKINSALAFAGETGLVRTIQEELDIPIHRYLQVDFNGFLELIRVLGGINVYTDYPLRDPKAQFEVLQTGCVNLTPDQALGYVRARSLQALIDGQWKTVDSRSDLGRIDRQQDFLVLALNRAFSQGLSNPATLKGLVDNVSGFVTLDDRLTPQELVDLAGDFRGFAGDELLRFTLPVVLGTAGEQSVVRLVEGEAQEVLAVFRGETEQVRRIRLAVRNGIGTSGLASEVQFAVAQKGFTVFEATNADGFGYEQTTIRFDPSQRNDAEELERWIVGGAVLDERDEDGFEPLELIVGADWDGVLDAPRPLPGEDDTNGGAEVVITDPTVGPSATPVPTPEPPAITSIRGC